jgi:hypothetical protein
MRKISAIMVLVGMISGCAEYGGQKLNVDPAEMGPACANYLACVDERGFGSCVQALSMATQWEPKDMSLLIAMSDDVDFVNMIALAQNASCLATAGADCDKVFACLNNGSAVRNCTPPANAVNGRSCADSKTLKACTQTGLEGVYIETSASCSDLGLECADIVIPEAEDKMAACVESKIEYGLTMDVSCHGTVAEISMLGVVVRYDCAFEGGTCKAGSHTDPEAIEDQLFCEGVGDACDEQSFDSYCDGNDMIGCMQGKESATHCDQFGSVCRTETHEYFTITGCLYPSCTPIAFEETCTDGLITYCAPEGSATLQCKDLGFTGCEAEQGRVKCTKE